MANYPEHEDRSCDGGCCRWRPFHEKRESVGHSQHDSSLPKPPQAIFSQLSDVSDGDDREINESPSPSPLYPILFDHLLRLESKRGKVARWFHLAGDIAFTLEVKGRGGGVAEEQIKSNNNNNNQGRKCYCTKWTTIHIAMTTLQSIATVVVVVAPATAHDVHMQ